MWNKGTTQISTSYYYYHTPTSTPAPTGTVKHDTGRTCLRSPQPQQELSFTWEYPNPSRNCLSPEITPTPAGTVTWEYPNPSRNCHTRQRPDLPDSTPTPAGTVTQDRDQTYLTVPQPQQELSHKTETRPTWQYPNPSRNCHTRQRPDLLRVPQPQQELSHKTETRPTWEQKARPMR